MPQCESIRELYRYCLDDESNKRATYYLHAQFLGSIADIEIPENFASGRVAILGCGNFAPEKSLFCTKESCFKIPKQTIKQLLLVDQDAFPLPSQYHFSWPVKNYRDYDPDENAVILYPENAAEFLGNMPEGWFHSITFLRIQNLYKNINEDFMAYVTRALEPGGFFIATGGGYEDIFYNQILLNGAKVDEMCKKNNLLLLKYYRLSDSDYNFLYNHNVGFVIQKQ